MASTQRHTIHLPDGTRVEVHGDRYEIHLAAPIVVHRRHWTVGLTASDEVRRTTLAGTAASVIDKALEAAFRAVPQRVDGDDDRPRHYDS